MSTPKHNRGTSLEQPSHCLLPPYKSFLPFILGDLDVVCHGCVYPTAIPCCTRINPFLLEKSLADFLFKVHNLLPVVVIDDNEALLSVPARNPHYPYPGACLWSLRPTTPKSGEDQDVTRSHSSLTLGQDPGTLACFQLSRT